MGKQGRFGKYERYVNIFNDMSRDWEAIVDLRDTRREARFVEEAMTKKGILLDLCCGTGRHAIILRKRGWNVIGIDLSRRLLAIAKQRMRKEGANLPLIRADMRCFPVRSQVFNGVMNMFTSFGYLPSEEEDLKCLSEIRRTLRKKGRFLLDLANRDHIIRNFRERDWAEFEPYYLLERRSLDFSNSKLASLWTLVAKDDGRTKFITHEVRLYTLDRIERLCKEAGLNIREVYGGYEKQEFGLDTSRMIIVAQKP